MGQALSRYGDQDAALRCLLASEKELEHLCSNVYCDDMPASEAFGLTQTLIDEFGINEEGALLQLSELYADIQDKNLTFTDFFGYSKCVLRLFDLTKRLERCPTFGHSNQENRIEQAQTSLIIKDGTKIENESLPQSWHDQNYGSNPRSMPDLPSNNYKQNSNQQNYGSNPRSISDLPSNNYNQNLNQYVLSPVLQNLNNALNPQSMPDLASHYYADNQNNQYETPTRDKSQRKTHQTNNHNNQNITQYDTQSPKIIDPRKTQSTGKSLGSFMQDYLPSSSTKKEYPISVTGPITSSLPSVDGTITSDSNSMYLKPMKSSPRPSRRSVMPLSNEDSAQVPAALPLSPPQNPVTLTLNPQPDGGTMQININMQSLTGKEESTPGTSSLPRARSSSPIKGRNIRATTSSPMWEVTSAIRTAPIINSRTVTFPTSASFPSQVLTTPPDLLSPMRSSLASFGQVSGQVPVPIPHRTQSSSQISSGTSPLLLTAQPANLAKRTRGSTKRVVATSLPTSPVISGIVIGTQSSQPSQMSPRTTERSSTTRQSTTSPLPIPGKVLGIADQGKSSLPRARVLSDPEHIYNSTASPMRQRETVMTDAQADALHQRLQAMTTEASQSDMQLRNSIAENQKLKNEVINCDSQLTRASEDIENQMKLHKESEDQVKILQERLSETLVEVYKYKGETLALQMETNISIGEVKSLRQETIAAAKEKAQLRREVDELRKQLEEKEESYKHLNDELKQTHEEKITALEDAEDKEKRLKKRTSQFTDAMTELQDELWSEQKQLRSQATELADVKKMLSQRVSEEDTMSVQEKRSMERNQEFSDRIHSIEESYEEQLKEMQEGLERAERARMEIEMVARAVEQEMEQRLLETEDKFQSEKKLAEEISVEFLEERGAMNMKVEQMEQQREQLEQQLILLKQADTDSGYHPSAEGSQRLQNDIEEYQFRLNQETMLRKRLEEKLRCAGISMEQVDLPPHDPNRSRICSPHIKSRTVSPSRTMSPYLRSRGSSPQKYEISVKSPSHYSRRDIDIGSREDSNSSVQNGLKRLSYRDSVSPYVRRPNRLQGWQENDISAERMVVDEQRRDSTDCRDTNRFQGWHESDIASERRVVDETREPNRFQGWRENDRSQDGWEVERREPNRLQCWHESDTSSERRMMEEQRREESDFAELSALVEEAEVEQALSARRIRPLYEEEADIGQLPLRSVSHSPLRSYRHTTSANRMNSLPVPVPGMNPRRSPPISKIENVSMATGKNNGYHYSPTRSPCNSGRLLSPSIYPSTSRQQYPYRHPPRPPGLHPGSQLEEERVLKRTDASHASSTPRQRTLTQPSPHSFLPTTPAGRLVSEGPVVRVVSPEKSKSPTPRNRSSKIDTRIQSQSLSPSLQRSQSYPYLQVKHHENSRSASSTRKSSPTNRAVRSSKTIQNPFRTNKQDNYSRSTSPYRTPVLQELSKSPMQSFTDISKDVHSYPTEKRLSRSVTEPLNDVISAPPEWKGSPIQNYSYPSVLEKIRSTGINTIGSTSLSLSYRPTGSPFHRAVGSTNNPFLAHMNPDAPNRYFQDLEYSPKSPETVNTLPFAMSSTATITTAATLSDLKNSSITGSPPAVASVLGSLRRSILKTEMSDGSKAIEAARLSRNSILNKVNVGNVVANPKLISEARLLLEKNKPTSKGTFSREDSQRSNSSTLALSVALVQRIEKRNNRLSQALDTVSILKSECESLQRKS